MPQEIGAWGRRVTLTAVLNLCACGFPPHIPCSGRLPGPFALQHLAHFGEERLATQRCGEEGKFAFENASYTTAFRAA